MSWITDYGMFELEVSGYGNCQFRALARQLYGSSEMHEEVRRQVVQQLEENHPMYEGFVQDYEQYCETMAKLGEWGDHVTLQTAADRFAVEIHLLTSFEKNGVIEIVRETKCIDVVIYG